MRLGGAHNSTSEHDIKALRRHCAAITIFKRQAREKIRAAEQEQQRKVQEQAATKQKAVEAKAEVEAARVRQQQAEQARRGAGANSI